jgi:hypothetical protein
MYKAGLSEVTSCPYSSNNHSLPNLLMGRRTPESKEVPKGPNHNPIIQLGMLLLQPPQAREPPIPIRAARALYCTAASLLALSNKMKRATMRNNMFVVCASKLVISKPDPNQADSQVPQLTTNSPYLALSSATTFPQLSQAGISPPFPASTASR